MNEEKKANWKKTLNLPSTSFSMRANLKENEPKSISRWIKRDLYRKLTQKSENKPLFFLHDGPPYANGEIHAGHLLNKVLKDIVFRSKLMAGYQSQFIPGWDCHGLPIEYRVLSELKEKGKFEKIDRLEEGIKQNVIRKACSEYALKQMKGQKKQMERLLTIADYKNPYLTMDSNYEAATLHVFANIVKKGLVTRRRKPVHWSTVNQTALAEAELEYKDKEDLSIYVNFRLCPKSYKELFTDVKEEISVMIWTTTPWTIPANMAVAVGEAISYSLIKIKGQNVIVATDRIKQIEQISKVSAIILKEISGSDLVGLKYYHPFCNREGTVVLADYVTTEDGTGLVHTAPGHGVEDWQTGIRENIEIYCPVKEDGSYNETVPEWIKGKNIWDANDLIVEKLNDSKNLFYAHLFEHSYPHDGRSHTPVIFRATEQWFIQMDYKLEHGKTLRELSLDAIKREIKFTPEWGQSRLGGMLSSRPDWCISRQRSWGLPIPAFSTSDGQILMTESTVRAVAEVFEKESSNAWFDKSPEELLQHWDSSLDKDAPENIDIKDLQKLDDIFDIWFEAGSSWFAVMKNRVKQIPSDLYLEGSDQHRGWFQLSLLPSLAATGNVPAKAILTHGFVVDKHGHKMSKSVGNTVEVGKMIEIYGADVCRWWVTSLAFESDNRLDLDFLNVASESYRKIRNTLRFLLSNLQGYDYKTHNIDFDTHTLEAWLLKQTKDLFNVVTGAYDNYTFRKAHQSLYDFCNETLSAVYCKAVKDRLYCDSKDSSRRVRSQAAMYEVLKTITTLIAPILPHTSDEVWRCLFGDNSCIHEKQFYFIDASMDKRWEKVMLLRHKILKALEHAKSMGIENPLDAGVKLANENDLEDFTEDIVDLCGISRVEWVSNSVDIEIIDLRPEPRCERSWRRDASVKKRPDGSILSERDWHAVNNKRNEREVFSE